MDYSREIKLVPIGELKPASYNPRKWDDKAIKDLTESVNRFGLVDPIIVNSAPERLNTVIGGHFRLKVAKDMGYTEVPVVFVNIPSEEKERELNLRLNKNLGAWDWSALADFDDIVLQDVGFSSEEIDKIFDQRVEEDEFDAEKEYANILNPVTQSGDLYLLGEHKLLCGDSTKRESYERLFGDDRARMIFTDPPYNVNYNYDKFKAIHKGRKAEWSEGGRIYNDNMSDEAFYAFLYAVFTNCYELSGKDTSIYVCHATKTQQQFFQAFKDAGWHFSQTIIWLKERFILAMGQDYHRVYEPIMFGWKEGEVHYKNLFITTEQEVWNLDKKKFEEQLDIWYEHRDKSADYEHPTQKPVRLPERAIKKNSERGDIVLEPFGGSGSTLLACEQLNRKCYSIELDPKYCDVIVRRWERFTGQKAERIPFEPEKPL